MSFTEWNDRGSRMLHEKTAHLMKPVLAEICPGHELRNIVIRHHFDGNKVILELHIEPITNPLSWPKVGNGVPALSGEAKG